MPREYRLLKTEGRALDPSRPRTTDWEPDTYSIVEVYYHEDGMPWFYTDPVPVIGNSREELKRQLVDMFKALKYSELDPDDFPQETQKELPFDEDDQGNP